MWTEVTSLLSVLLLYRTQRRHKYAVRNTRQWRHRTYSIIYVSRAWGKSLYFQFFSMQPVARGVSDNLAVKTVGKNWSKGQKMKLTENWQDAVRRRKLNDLQQRCLRLVTKLKVFGSHANGRFNLLCDIVHGSQCCYCLHGNKGENSLSSIPASPHVMCLLMKKNRDRFSNFPLIGCSVYYLQTLYQLERLPNWDKIMIKYCKMERTGQKYIRMF